MSPLGRPRNPELDDAAIRTAIQLIVDDGYPALTMERIAVRASVSRAALYRRWPNKVELVVDAIESLANTQGPLPDTGRLRDDVVEYLYALVRNRLADVEAYEALIAAAAGDPELGHRCRDTLLGRFSDSFRTIVTRAVDRGELPADTDIELLADLVPALALHRAQTTGKHLDEEFVDRMATQFFTPANTSPAKDSTLTRQPRLGTKRPASSVPGSR
jgi:AcrR family transcriptional regulator